MHEREQVIAAVMSGRQRHGMNLPHGSYEVHTSGLFLTLVDGEYVLVAPSGSWIVRRPAREPDQTRTMAIVECVYDVTGIMRFSMFQTEEMPVKMDREDVEYAVAEVVGRFIVDGRMAEVEDARIVIQPWVIRKALECIRLGHHC